MSVTRGTGWLPDAPDFRDYDPESPTIQNELLRVGIADPSTVLTPASVDLRRWCSPIDDQGRLESCSAHAGVALLEFFERRALGRHIDASRMFLYKATRNLAGVTGNKGAYLRDTMKAMALFGVPPEKYWPYRVEHFDREPTAFCYSYAQSFKAIQYYRLDPPSTSRQLLMDRIRASLASGLPVMFGFTVYSSYEQADISGEIPMPSDFDTRAFSHAVVAVGYDDHKRIENRNDGSTTTGALLIRNSWGTDWGRSGYGWLPFEYVQRRMAVDWWTLLNSEWIDTGAFRA